MTEIIIRIQKYNIYNIYRDIYTNTVTVSSITKASDVYIYKQYWLKNP